MPSGRCSQGPGLSAYPQARNSNRATHGHGRPSTSAGLALLASIPTTAADVIWLAAVSIMQLRRLNKDGAVPLCRWWRKDWGRRGEQEGERRRRRRRRRRDEKTPRTMHNMRGCFVVYSRRRSRHLCLLALFCGISILVSRRL